MDDDHDKEQDRVSDNLLRDWEDQCIEEWEHDPNNMADRIQYENERSTQKLWLSFQNSATSIAQLYRVRCQDGVAMWIPFQNSASSVTRLYKDSMDAVKHSYELGAQNGHHRRTKELINWAKKKRRHIRREDLIAYLCGKPVPVVRPRSSTNLNRSKVTTVDHHRMSPRLPPPEDIEDPSSEPDLRPFRDALVLQRLNGAMSNISVGYQGRPTTPPPAQVGSEVEACSVEDDDFHCFILDEISRRCDSARKRAPTNSDVLVDSPSRKRSRLL